MQKILFIVPLPPPVHGSSIVGRNLRESEEINEDLDAIFVNLSTSRSLDEIGKKPLLKGLRFVAVVVKVLWLLLTHRFDKCYIAMQCYGIGFVKDAMIALLCKMFCQRLIIHHHTFGIERYKERPFYKRLYRWVYNGSTVVLLSERMRKAYGEVLDGADVRIVPNGIESHVGEIKKENGDRVRLLFLSNLLETKGVMVLLDACKMLKDRGMEYECDFVGAESAEIDAARFAHEVAERELDGQVKYLGTKFGEDKWKCYAESDVFVHPSYDDCMPLVILEAMDSGLPVVATDVGCVPDEVEDGVTGLICRQRNTESLADCLERLVRDKELREMMGQAGRERFYARFTRIEFERNMLSVLKD